MSQPPPAPPKPDFMLHLEEMRAAFAREKAVRKAWDKEINRIIEKKNLRQPIQNPEWRRR